MDRALTPDRAELRRKLEEGAQSLPLDEDLEVIVEQLRRRAGS